MPVRLNSSGGGSVTIDAPVTSQNITVTAPTQAGAYVIEGPQVTLASASTVAIGAATSRTINISGTTTITAFDSTTGGITRTLTFQGALTLTHNATSLILPGAANITTAANDVAEFESLGGGNWRCTSYTRASGTSVVPPVIPTNAYVGERGQVFTSSGTFTVPTGVTAVKVTVVGGGGNGSGATNDAGGGGGGGGVAIRWVTGLTPGGTVSVTVGGAGGTSSFGAFCSATGGSNGANETITGGNGGSGSGGDINLSGGRGGDGANNDGVGGVGGGGGAGGGSAVNMTWQMGKSVGGAGLFGAGANGTTAFQSNGTAAGGRGNGGAGGWGSAGFRSGGAGSGGIVVVEW